jgi:hypothetical protein
MDCTEEGREQCDTFSNFQVSVPTLHVTGTNSDGNKFICRTQLAYLR